jgi:TatD DNase family protein
MRLYDTHCHLQDERLAPEIDPILRRAEAAGVIRLRCCGTVEADWQAVAQLAMRFPSVRPAYGLHPWYIAGRTPAWKYLLRARLLCEPRAIMGEVGLDHAVAAPDRADQASVFLEQLQLAAELKRPVSLHCRQAWGALLALLRGLEPLPPALVFHSYSGDAELIPLLTKLNGYFSFSGSLTRQGNRRGHAAAQQVPADRLLLESDSPDLAPRPIAPDKPNEPSFMLHTLAELAVCRGLSAEEAAALTWNNACRIFEEPPE